ncbi:hypothetical protein BVX93_00930 [bacterium B13(2017)]|nr:hypothetical protein BVX93_00930 [bacterium B13(2017)]
MVYGVYEYILGNTNFDSGRYLSLRKYVDNSGIEINQILKPLLDFSDSVEKNSNQSIIVPNTFIFSKDFYQVAQLGLTVPVNKMVNEN